MIKLDQSFDQSSTQINPHTPLKLIELNAWTKTNSVFRNTKIGGFFFKKKIKIKIRRTRNMLNIKNTCASISFVCVIIDEFSKSKLKLKFIFYLNQFDF